MRQAVKFQHHADHYLSAKDRGDFCPLLPFHEDGMPDYDAFLAHVARTFTAGLTPAVNMDTGYTNLLTREMNSARYDPKRNN